MPECGYACGLMAAFVAAVAFGSYSVPMKGEASTKVDVDPLVFQTYKTFMVFVTSWLVLFLGIQPSFTPWGIVSAAFWVPGGTAGIYAVRRAGLAVSVGIWSSVIVSVSFLWGIVIFGEQVHSMVGAAAAAVLLCLGLWGVAFYSSPGHQKAHAKVIRQKHVEDYSQDRTKASADEGADVETTPLTLDAQDRYGSAEALTEDGYVHLDLEHYPHSGAPPWGEKEVDFFVIHDTQYHLGLAMAAVNGLLGASIMVPLHYAGPNTTGMRFAISFGVGAVMITALLWLIRFSYNTVQLGSLRAGYETLPPFHVRIMWRSGCLSGLLYSIGNLTGIYAITVLGDFMGYSLGQSSLLVSGLWAIFWYREVTAVSDVVGWLVSACVVFAGILWLGHEHVQ